MADGDSLIVLGEDDVGVLEDALDFVNALPRTDGKAMRGRRTGVISPIVQLVQITSGTADGTTHRYPGKVIQASSDGTTLSLTQLATCEAIDANGGALAAGYYLGILSGTKTDGTPLYEVIAGVPDILADRTHAGDVSLAVQEMGAGLKIFGDAISATYNYETWWMPSGYVGPSSHIAGAALDTYGHIVINGTDSELRWSINFPSFASSYNPNSSLGTHSPFYALDGFPNSFTCVFSISDWSLSVLRMNFGFVNAHGNFPANALNGTPPGLGWYYDCDAVNGGLVTYPRFGVCDDSGTRFLGRTLGSLPGSVFKGGLFVDGPVYPGSDGGTFP